MIGAVSGGVDSSVAAKLMHEAIGDRSVFPAEFLVTPFKTSRFHAIMVDNGVLRKDEAVKVHEMLTENLGVNLTVVDASELFLSRLRGIEDPERKRKIIGNTFIEVFEEEATKLEAAAEKELAEKGGEAKGKIEWLLQGTLYPDVIESISFKGPSATIKTHHNVGGLLEDMKLKLIEPLRELFKGEDKRLRRGLLTSRRGQSPWKIVRYTSTPCRATSFSWTRLGDQNIGRGHARTDQNPSTSGRHLHRGGPSGRAVRPDISGFRGLTACEGSWSRRRC